MRGAQVIPLYRQDASHPQAQVCAQCEVRRSALFGALDAAALDQIHTHIASLTLAPGQTIYRRGEQGSAVYTVRSGVVRFERVTERGDRTRRPPHRAAGRSRRPDGPGKCGLACPRG